MIAHSAAAGRVYPPDSAELAELASLWKSAYVHIPFCAKWCPYCDFTVVEGRLDVADRYVAAVVSEIESEPPWHPLDAVFFGGGTPSLLGAARVAVIVDALERRFGLVQGAEVTLEANPEGFDRSEAEAMNAAGITRISFGAQSFDDSVLDRLGRQHRAQDIGEAVTAARISGVESVALDLIFGTPGESMDSWKKTLASALSVGPDHLSVYGLTIEPATGFGRAARNGGPVPDPDVQAAMWDVAAESLGAAGFLRYEVSNYALDGRACRYNLSVWGRGEYLAFGLGAHRHRDGMRSVNVRRLDTYLDRVERGIGPVQNAESVEGWAAEQERLMLGLRRVAGAIPGRGGAALAQSEEGRRLFAVGIVDVVDGRLVVLKPLLTDAVVRTVLGLGDPV